MRGANIDDWILDLSATTLSEVRLYHYVGSELRATDRSGALLPIRERSVAKPHLAFPLSLGAGQNEIYLRIRSDALSKVFNTTTLDVAVAYRWKNWTFTLFSNNVLDKRYPVNVNRVFDSQFVSEPMPALPLAPATSLPAPTGLLTNMHYNQAKHTGLTITW